MLIKRFHDQNYYILVQVIIMMSCLEKAKA